MFKNKRTGKKGEMFVIDNAPCPNCKKQLMSLPENYPLYDVQCTGCSFRAQIKTNNSRPKDQFFGAGWEIMHKVLKSGFIVPPLIAVFNWKEKNQKRIEIRFYPFVPKINLKKFQLSSTHRQPNYKMFRYNNMNELPFFTLYNK